MTSRPYGMTLQVQVGDLARAREFYMALLGSSPEFEPHQGSARARSSSRTRTSASCG